MSQYNSIQGILDDHAAPANVTHVSQDQDGKVHGFFAMPKRVNGAVEWTGIGKVLIVDLGPDNVIGSWHNFYLNMANYSKAKSVEFKKKETKTERQFVDLPDDYGIAIAYAKKVANSRERNINFELTFEQFRDLFLCDTCCVSGNKLIHGGNPVGMNQHSLDRVDPNKGYVVGNCVVMAATLNIVKSDVDKMLANVQASDEQKLKILYKAENVLRKRIKAAKKIEEEADAASRQKATAFEDRFSIFPK
ncbi:MAG: hypothetical protein ACRC6V_18055 [Bacteroidales bacterium]